MKWLDSIIMLSMTLLWAFRLPLKSMMGICLDDVMGAISLQHWGKVSI